MAVTIPVLLGNANISGGMHAGQQHICQFRRFSVISEDVRWLRKNGKWKIAAVQFIRNDEYLSMYALQQRNSNPCFQGQTTRLVRILSDVVVCVQSKMAAINRKCKQNNMLSSCWETRGTHTHFLDRSQQSFRGTIVRGRRPEFVISTEGGSSSYCGRRTMCL